MWHRRRGWSTRTPTGSGFPPTPSAAVASAAPGKPPSPPPPEAKRSLRCRRSVAAVTCGWCTSAKRGTSRPSFGRRSAVRARTRASARPRRCLPLRRASSTATIPIPIPWAPLAMQSVAPMSRPSRGTCKRSSTKSTRTGAAPSTGRSSPRSSRPTASSRRSSERLTPRASEKLPLCCVSSKRARSSTPTATARSPWMSLNEP